MERTEQEREFYFEKLQARVLNVTNDPPAHSPYRKSYSDLDRVHVLDDPPGGSLETTTRPMSNRRNSRHVCMSVHSQGGHDPIWFEWFFSMTMLPGYRVLVPAPRVR